MAGVLEGGARYLVHHRLGAGGMGVVHLGTMVTPAGERKIAIKQLSARQSDPAATERIVAEARLVFQLTHPNICQVLDLAVNDEGTFVVMEYVDGGDVKTLLARTRDAGEQLEVAAAIYIAREVADALDYAHRRKDDRGAALWLVHGDVTPQNILFSREGEVKLADFGIARALGQGPGNELVAGTPGFMAPEAVSGNVDQRADIYSLGVCLYVALSGKSPQAGGLSVHALIEDRPDVPSELGTILDRALATRREDRFSTVGELKRALSLYLAQRHPTFSRESMAEIVQQRNLARDAPAVEESLSLVSLTGTATFLAPMGAITGAPSEEVSHASPHGTERAQRHTPKRSRAPMFVGGALVTLVLAALLFRILQKPTQPHAVNTRAPSPPAVAPPPQAVAPPLYVAAPSPAVAARPKPARAPSTSAELGYLTVNAEPWGTVMVDGKRFADQTPVYNAPIAAGKHKVSVFSPISHVAAPPRSLVVEPRKHYVLGFDLVRK